MCFFEQKHPAYRFTEIRWEKRNSTGTKTRFSLISKKQNCDKNEFFNLTPNYVWPFHFGFIICDDLLSNIKQINEILHRKSRKYNWNEEIAFTLRVYVFSCIKQNVRSDEILFSSLEYRHAPIYVKINKKFCLLLLSTNILHRREHFPLYLNTRLRRHLNTWCKRRKKVVTFQKDIKCDRKS